MAGEFTHASVGTDLTQAEWEALATHIADGQVKDDVLYFNGTYWVRIGGEIVPIITKGGNVLHITTQAGWTASNTGTGGNGGNISYMYVLTGTTASSRGLVYALMNGFEEAGGIWSYFNYDKKLYLIFNYRRNGSDSEAVARFQLKRANTEGALADLGIGIRADNLDLIGESYGTELGEVDLGTTLATDRVSQIVIIHYPGSKIEWYVDGTLKGTQSTAAKIPSGSSASANYLVSSIVNGVTGGVNAIQAILHPKIWQER